MKCCIEIPSSPILRISWILSLVAILLLFSSISTNSSVEAKYVFSKKWGTLGSGNGQFQFPRSVVTDNAGNVYVAEGIEGYQNSRIQKFKLVNPCPAGTTQVVSGVCFVTKWGTLGSGNGQFQWPSSVAIDSSSNVYVADSDNNRIQVFRASGTFLKSWGTMGSGNGQFLGPVDLSFDSSGNVYVADFGNNRIQKFKLADTCPAGTTQVVTGVCFVTKWGEYGNGEGEFDRPDSVAVDSSGIVYVVEWGNNRVQAFTNNGIFIKAWGTAGTEDGQFRGTADITVDSFGRVYVADYYNSRIQIFQLTPNPCPEGTKQISTYVCFITKWGNKGTADGQFDLPGSVAIGTSSVFVSDNRNHRIQEFFWKTDVGGPGGSGVSPNIAVK